MILDFVIFAFSIRFLYLAYGLWKHRDIRKYGNRYSRGSKIKDVDAYIGWWVKWNVINGILGITFATLDVINNYYMALGVGIVYIGGALLIGILVSTLYPLMNSAKFQ